MEAFAKYFLLEEFLASKTARDNKIDNSPSWEVVNNLHELAQFLDGLREKWGSGIRVSSGFRCEKLNKAVNGAPTSLHQKGFAADLQPVNGKFEEFKKCVIEWIKDKDFDQCILEKNGKGVYWIHIGLYNNAGKQRKYIFSMNVK